jgi:cupin fold WbuC family metalloprotein
MKVVTAETMASLVARAAEVPRKRTNLDLHATPEDPVNRFLNAGLAGTYVRPHRHRRDKWEFLSLLQGRIDVLIFSADGEVRDRTALFTGGASVMEIPGGEWHSLVFGAPAAVLLEVKPGPYEPDLDKEFAAWAPAEGSAGAASFTAWLETAARGDVWPLDLRRGRHTL